MIRPDSPIVDSPIADDSRPRFLANDPTAAIARTKALEAEVARLKRERDSATYSPADLDRMDADSDDAIMLDDLRDNFEAVVEGSYRVDARAEDEGFGKELGAELIVNVRIPESFAFTALVSVRNSRDLSAEREFVARRLETGEADVVRYSVGLK